MFEFLKKKLGLKEDASAAPEEELAFTPVPPPVAAEVPAPSEAVDVAPQAPEDVAASEALLPADVPQEVLAPLVETPNPPDLPVEAALEPEPLPELPPEPVVAVTEAAQAIAPTESAPAPEVPAPSPVAEAGSAPPAPVAVMAVQPVAPAQEAFPAPEPAQEEAPKSSWMQRLKAGLSRTSAQIGGIFVRRKIDEELLEELETTLLMADCGIEATQYLLDELRRRWKQDRLETGDQLREVLAELLTNLLKPLQQPLTIGAHRPFIIMLAGVNGAGKTTSIGKLARHFQRQGKSVLLAAGDTFRAAAREQLMEWGRRNDVTVIAQEGGDPAAVAFDAVSAAHARNIDVVMVDTAGRLPTQLHLMEEIAKVRRVVQKADPSGPHEVLLVLDGNVGQNALAQLKAFDKAVGVTGLVVTKLDGTAKGGVIAAIARTHVKPMRFIGVGEGIDDLQVFNAAEYVDALLGTGNN